MFPMGLNCGVLNQKFNISNFDHAIAIFALWTSMTHDKNCCL